MPFGYISIHFQELCRSTNSIHLNYILCRTAMSITIISKKYSYFSASKSGQLHLLVQLTGFLIILYSLLNRTLIIQPFLKLLSLNHNTIPIMQDPLRPFVILHHASHLLISNMEINRSFFHGQQISFIKCNAQFLIRSHN